MGELGKNHDMGTLYSDSQSAIHLAINSTFHSRTKHIQLKYHIIRSVLEDGELKLEKIHTSQNPADMLTKVVTREKLRICSVSVGLQGWRWRWETARSKEESLSSKWSSGGVATISLQVGDCWVWSLIIFYIQKYRHFGPQFKMGAATPPVKYSLQGGFRGGRLRPLGAPPWRGVSGAAPPKLKTAVKLPCKSIVISSQSGPFIRRMIWR